MKKWDKINSEYWDINYRDRANDIEQGRDVTYINTIIPYVKKFLKENIKEHEKVLDAGCGCGFMTNLISSTNEVVGIDISEMTINYCKNKYPNIPFECRSIYDITLTQKFDLCTSIMVVHSLNDYNGFLKAVNSILNERGLLLFIIPHPCFWPYKKVPQRLEYKYNISKSFRIPFRIRNNTKYPSEIVFFHRSLSTYVNSALLEGYELVRFDELYESKECGLRKNEPDLLALIMRKR